MPSNNCEVSGYSECYPEVAGAGSGGCESSPDVGAGTGGDAPDACEHRLAKLSEPKVDFLRLRGKIGEHLADYKLLFTVLSAESQEVQAAIGSGQDSIVAGGQILAVRKCVKMRLSELDACRELRIHWGESNAHKRQDPLVHGIICPRSATATRLGYVRCQLLCTRNS